MDLHETQTMKGALCMDRITQIGYWRQRAIKYAQTHGVTAAIRNRISRKTICKWRKRYGGKPEGSAPHAAAQSKGTIAGGASAGQAVREEVSGRSAAGI